MPLQIPTDFQRWATVGGGHSLQKTCCKGGFVSPSALKRSQGRGHGVRTDQCTAGNVLSQSPRFALMSRACRQRCRLEIGHEFDMRFTSKAARFGSLVPPATSPLTASMPSTDGHRRMHVLSVEPAAHVPACSAVCGVIGKQIGKHVPTVGIQPTNKALDVVPTRLADTRARRNPRLIELDESSS